MDIYSLNKFSIDWFKFYGDGLLNKLIVLLTDFGYSDPYVGVMKGVIKSINPFVDIIDLTHGVSRHDVVEAALILMVSAKYFPRNTIFVSVVDPGVGGSRRALLIRTRDYYLIGPDNGCLTLLARENGIVKVYDISNSRFRLREVSHTFHGRDVFAPVAAYLSLGYSMEELGVEINPGDIEFIEFREPIISGDEIRGEVIYIDIYGNIMTNIMSNNVDQMGFREGDVLRIMHRGMTYKCRYVKSFSHVNPGEYACYLNSWGYFEIAINMGSASKEMGVSRGDEIILSKKD